MQRPLRSGLQPQVLSAATMKPRFIFPTRCVYAFAGSTDLSLRAA
jgi:hypothetical protein